MRFIVNSEHNRPGHLNVYTPDEHSEETGFGKHARCVCFHPDHEGLYCRIDRASKVKAKDPLYPNLPDPTPAQILKVARKNPGIRGRWILKSREVWPDGHSIDYYFTKAV